jgi:hypothetical protein
MIILFADSIHKDISDFILQSEIIVLLFDFLDAFEAIDAE